MSFPGDIGVEFFRANKDYACSGCGGSVRKGQIYAREYTYLNRIKVYPHIRDCTEAIVCLCCSTVAFARAHQRPRLYELQLPIHKKWKPKKRVYFAQNRMEKLCQNSRAR